MMDCPEGRMSCSHTCRFHLADCPSGMSPCWWYRGRRIESGAINDRGPQQVVKIFVQHGVRSYVPQKPPVHPPVIPSKSTGFDVELQAIDKANNEPG